ncbi:cyclic nucleotide-binding domain-containing protein [candidate division KSB1 bacterium]
MKTEKLNTDIFRDMPIFGSLDKEQLETVVKYMSLEFFRAGENIIVDGEKGDSMYFLLSGEVEISKRLTLRVSHRDFDEKDKQFIRLKSESYPFFGEMALFDKDSLRTATVTALVDCDIAEIKKNDFEELCRSDYRIGFHILHHLIEVLCKRLDKNNKDILKLTTAFSIALEGN